MQKYQNNATTLRGDAIKGASITVTTLAGALATLYSDNGVTVQSNPIITGRDGEYSFYAADGRYNISISAPGFDGDLISDYSMGDPLTMVATAAAAGAAAAQAIKTQIDNRYRGALAADPATRTDGSANQVGDAYFYNGGMPNLTKTFNGATWQASDINTANLAATDGAALLGYDGGTTQTILDDAKPMASYAALRAYTGRATGIRITAAGIAGTFQRSATDTTSADNGGTVIVDGAGRRWLRLFAGAVHAQWFGASAAASATVNTAAIQAAYLAAVAATCGLHISGAGTIEHTGLTFNRAIPVTGEMTPLKNLGVGTSGIAIKSQAAGQAYIVGAGMISGFVLSGTSTGPTIEYDTESNFVLRDISILGAAGNGISVGTTQHASVLTLDRVKVQGCAGHGIYGRALNTKQINAVNILNSEFQGNGGNGVDLFANVLNIKDSVIQGNAGVGVNLDSADNLTSSYTVNTLNMEDNYLEKNTGGNLRVKGGVYPGGIFKLIGSLRVTGNYFFTAAGATAPSILFSRRGDGVTSINGYLNSTVRTMQWANNSVASDAVDMDVVDFDHALTELCVVNLTSSLGLSTYTGTEQDVRLTKFTNIGRAKLLGAQNQVIPGAFLAKSAAIAYTSLTSRKSDAIATTATYKTVSFPILLPTGALLLGASVPVYWTDIAKLCDVQITVQKADVKSEAAWTSMINTFRTGQTHNSTTTPLIVKAQTLEEVTSNADTMRSGFGKEEWILTIGIRTNSGSTDSSYFLGNPVIRFN